ncbi:9,11-endoperoxide prostaglandin H2 reductase [Amphibalanus amphitrite]|uniref:9,11-endoperoxide prostaglandin H2 reductase n=1 Tax=Amphibalanus amphitrite TaxID=1232801 RepID=A0A6A4VRF1_AMPAM|nr:9,11-endoperoxide prostaglandin H2 reductase [Amphibalanus amphitrite]
MGSSVKLNNGQKMPLLGLGCWQAPGDEVAAAVEAALLAGYRHIDTAYNYLNEDGVGRGIKAALASGKVKRSDIFVVTKLPMIGMQAGKVEKYLKKSIKALGLDYIDLYLVHAPLGFAERSETDPSSVTVYFQQLKMREVCKKHNIAITAYAPLASPGRKVLYEKRGVKIELPDLLNNPVVRLVAEKHNRTAAQVLLRFLVQQDIIVIPKSTNAGRIKQNGDIFNLQAGRAGHGSPAFPEPGRGWQKLHHARIPWR